MILAWRFPTRSKHEAAIPTAKASSAPCVQLAGLSILRSQCRPTGSSGSSHRSIAGFYIVIIISIRAESVIRPANMTLRLKRPSHRTNFPFSIHKAKGKANSSKMDPQMIEPFFVIPCSSRTLSCTVHNTVNNLSALYIADYPNQSIVNDCRSNNTAV